MNLRLFAKFFRLIRRFLNFHAHVVRYWFISSVQIWSQIAALNEKIPIKSLVITSRGLVT